MNIIQKIVCISLLSLISTVSFAEIAVIVNPANKNSMTKEDIAKIKQTLIAIFALNALVSKETQLLIFVNTAYLGHYKGHEVRGFAQAARVFFNKPFKELDRDQYLSLVAMIIGPNAFNVIKQPRKNAEAKQLK